MAYFYIKSDNDSTCSVNNLLQWVAFQISPKDSEYGSFAATAMRNERRMHIAKDTWDHLFKDYFYSYRFHGSARAIIDGVDEAPLDKQNLLSRIKKMLCAWQSSEKCRLQFLIIQDFISKGHLKISSKILIGLKKAQKHVALTCLYSIIDHLPSNDG